MKRLLILGILASVLSGCVVVPAADYDRRYSGAYYGHRYDRYGYDRYSYDRYGNTYSYYYDSRHRSSY